MKIFKCVQYTPAWWEARRGIVTASAADRILTPTGKVSAQQDGYIAELIADIVDLSPNAFSERGRIGTAAMEAGRQAEPKARNWYSMVRNVNVQQVGFVLSDCGRFGGSPDGLVGEEGGLELKCPLLKTQAGYLMDGEVLPNDYKPQVHFHLIVTNRPWWDFMSYAEGLPPLLIRVTPDDYTVKLAEALADFLRKYDAALAKLGVKPNWHREPVEAA